MGRKSHFWLLKKFESQNTCMSELKKTAERIFVIDFGDRVSQEENMVAFRTMAYISYNTERKSITECLWVDASAYSSTSESAEPRL